MCRPAYLLSMKTLLKPCSSFLPAILDWSRLDDCFRVFLLPDAEVAEGSAGDVFSVEGDDFQLPDGVQFEDRHSVWVAEARSDGARAFVMVLLEDGQGVGTLVAADFPERLAMELNRAA